MTPALSLTHVLERLRDARERVAHGAPSVAIALAGHPISTAQARLAEAEEARHAARAHPWALVLTEALALVEEAREAWGSAPAHMPPPHALNAPCAKELRIHLPDARACEDMRLAWEDPGGLSRTQVLCVVHLAVCLAEWRVLEEGGALAGGAGVGGVGTRAPGAERHCRPRYLGWPAEAGARTRQGDAQPP